MRVKGESAHALERSVMALCPAIAERLAQSPKATEYELRRELVGCILGSQVSHAAATAWTARLDGEGLFNDPLWDVKGGRRFRGAVERILGDTCNTGQGRYRFHRTRATQLGDARDVVSKTRLGDWLFSDVAPQTLRADLVDRMPGLGPKQASMLLRNAGVSYDLAVVDAHVLRYAYALGLVDRESARLHSLSSYMLIECNLRRYAFFLGYPVGCLDLAIWITMTALRQMTI